MPVPELAEAPRAAPSPRLSVIVPARNARLQLGRCLDGLCRSAYEDFEVIVVDDASTDYTREIAERYGTRYVRMPVSSGPGGARNLGVRHAAGQIVVFVDADVVLPRDALGRIADAFLADPELAAVFGSYDTAPAWRDFLSQYKNLMHHYVHQISREQAVTFWAGCGAMRKTVFAQFGGFRADKYPHPSIEDIELGLRLTSAGYKIRLEKQLQVKHLKRWTFRGLLRADILYRAVPWTRLILEKRDLPRDLNLTWPARVSAALVGLLVLALAVLPFSAAGMTGDISAQPLGAILPGIVVLLLALNWDVYAFFMRQRGWRFAAGAVLAHWLYYFYSGAVFAVLSVAHFARLPFHSAGSSASVSKAPE